MTARQKRKVASPAGNQLLVPSPAKDQELVARKQEQIVAGACRLFFNKGFHPTTIREIALASGMSMGQLYHYISGKDDVLFLVYRHLQRIWRRHLEDSGLEEIGDPSERLRQALHLTLRFMTAHKELFLFVYTETKNLEKKHLRAVLEMDESNVVGFWSRILREALPGAGKRGSLNLQANLISHLMMFIVMRGWNLEGAPERQMDQVVDFILLGLGLETSHGSGQD